MAFRSLMNQEEGDFETVLTSFQGACPHALGVLPLALVSVGLEQVQIWEGVEDHSMREKLTFLLKILPGSNRDQIISNWLVASQEWIIFHRMNVGDETMRIGDVLKVFVEKMSLLVEDGVVERNEIYDQAIYFVEELRNQRTTINSNLLAP